MKNYFDISNNFPINKIILFYKKGNDNYPAPNDGDISNQNPEMTQIVVDEEFDSQVKMIA